MPVVREAGTLDELRDDWIRLAEEAGDVFLTWEWAKAWEETHGSEGRVLLTFARRGEPVCAIVRLAPVRTRPVHIMGFEGQGPADQVGPVCHPRDRAAVGVALRRVLRARLGRAGVLVARGLMREQGWTPLLGGVVLHREVSPVLDIAGQAWDEWLATKSKNFRQQTRRRERRLVDDHALSYRRIEGPEALEEALAELVVLHDARWQGESDFFSPEGRALHSAFARRALERGWLHLWRAELEGRPAALQLDYRFGGDEWSFQAARDPAWQQSGVGMALLTHIVRRAFEDGCRRYRFLSGNHPYKTRFTTQDASHETVLVAAPGARGLLRLAIGVSRRAPASLKRAVGQRLRV